MNDPLRGKIKRTRFFLSPLFESRNALADICSLFIDDLKKKFSSFSMFFVKINGVLRHENVPIIILYRY